MGDFFRTFRLGEAEVTILSEGTGSWPMDLALDVPEQQWRPFVATDDRNRMPIGFNLALVRLGSTLVLVDAGFGEPTPEQLRMEQALEVSRSLGLDGVFAALDLRPADVDLVAITHAHGDHISGATVEREGRLVPRFPNARYVLGAAEYHDRSFRGMWGPAIDRSVDALHAAGHLELLEVRTTIAPGLEFIPAPGESPGHAIYRLAAGEDVLYFVGDLFHHPVEVSHLDWAPVRRDRVRLAASRRTLIEAALAEKAVLMVTHLPFPGLGRLRKVDGGVAWVDAAP